MSGFSGDWLSAREPVDLRARNAKVRDAFFNHLAVRRSSDPSRPLALLDLGAGTGATLRALAPHVATPQAWRLAEHDPALIARARTLMDGQEMPVEIVETDLATGVPEALLDGIDGVTTSAFLDLVSAGWISAFARQLAAHRLPFLAMLTYDGRLSLAPADPLDESIREAMNTHQHGDKGFGAALGPQASDLTREAFQQVNFRVVEGPSDWEAERGEQAFQSMLVDGWVEAARDMAVDADSLARWHERRRGEIAAQELVTRVGHRDLACLPV
ncbi:class I SAM-dependent methyltransferase [Stappia stellulata]|uniref:class I SAM-dependent methyltransferase n=1 Tax=Stappia stellulata TaxID=71235 RepID=UPI0004264AD4|nr:class I SAM-dependent methyltransferase [Stappia stellulata]